MKKSLEECEKILERCELSARNNEFKVVAITLLKEGFMIWDDIYDFYPLGISFNSKVGDWYLHLNISEKYEFYYLHAIYENQLFFINLNESDEERKISRNELNLYLKKIEDLIKTTLSQFQQSCLIFQPDF